MGKKRSTTSSAKRIKTRHKKTSKSRKLTTPSVSAAIKDINKVITDQLKANPKLNAKTDQPEEPAIEVETMTIDSLRKLTGDANKKEKVGKLSIDDGIYLEKMLKRWGTNYARMAQDIKLNRLQWTAQQI
jgi:hypothetical protein